jgi:adenosylhomocysteine nucleosidase
MRIVIIGAMKVEINFLLEKIAKYNTINHFKYTFYEGKFLGNELVIVESGIGKVASGMLVSAILNYYKNIDLIINVGVSGGVKGKVDIGEVVVATSLKYADVQVFNYEYGRMPNCPASFPTSIDLINKLNLKQSYKQGMIITGDKFYTDYSFVSSLIDTYFKYDNVLCIDMESAALAHASWFYGVDYLAIRAISDVIGNENQTNDYDNYLEIACLNSNNFLLEVLEKLKDK